MREFYIFGIIIVGLAVMPIDAMAQRKRVPAKPATTAAPAQSPRQLSPAEAFFQAGLKCEADDHDCKISNFTKAINLEFSSVAVFKNRGSSYLAKSEFEKAIADFTKCIEIDPNDATGFKLRGKAYLAQRNPESLTKALADFSSAAELEPRDVEALNLLGTVALRQGIYEKAIERFDRVISIDPNNADGYSNRSEVFRITGKIDLAIDAVSRSISIKPESAQYRTQRARLYSTQKKYDLAIADLTKAIDIDPNSMDALSLRALTYTSSGQLDEAIADYTRAIENSTRLKGYYYSKRAAIYATQDKNDLAMADLNKAIEIDPKNYAAYELRAGINFKLKNYDAAIDDAKAAIEIAPWIEDAYTTLAMATSSKAGSFNDVAQSYFRQSTTNRIKNATAIITRDPKNFEALMKRASAYASNQQYAEAITDYSAAIELDKRHIPAYTGRASAYSGIQTYDRAAADYTKILEIEPRNIPTLSARATLFYVFVKDLDRAAADLENLISLENRSEKDAPYYVAAVRQLAWIHAEQKKVDQGLAVLNKAIAAQPEDGKILSIRAEFYNSKAQQPALAVADYLKAIELSPSSAEIYYGLANAYLAQKDQTAAIAILAKSIETNPKDPLAYYYRGLFNWIGITKYAEAINDFTKCNELAANDNPYKEVCRLSVTNAQASQQREIANQAAAAAAREREREAARKRRADTVLTIMKGISDGLATPRRP